MRILGRGLLALLLLVLLFWLGQELKSRFSQWRWPGLAPVNAEPEAQVSTVYLTGAEWLSFPLPAGSQLLRLLSNASLPVGTEALDQPLPYTLEFRLLGPAGEELSRGLYQHRSRQDFLADGENGGARPAAYYPEGDWLPAEGRLLLLNLAGLAEPRTLQVRLQQGAPGIETVALRLYHLGQEAEHKLGFLWQRLSEGQRQSLARASVYPPELLSAEEKRNLVRQGWRPLGPGGVAGEDYQVRQLYQHPGTAAPAFEEPVLPSGLLISATHCGTLVLPPGGGTVRLELLPALAEQQPAAGEILNLTWWGDAPGERRRVAIPWQPGGTGYSASFAQGLLEIDAPGLVVVRAFLIAGEVETEITPPPLYLRGYLIAPQQELLYAVEHLGSDATPFRVDLRAFVSGTDEAAALTGGTVEFAWLDAAGAVLRSGSLALDPLPSRYDRLAERGLDQMLAEPVSYYFQLPPEAARLRLVASVPVLASAYTRPADLPRETRVPEVPFSPGEEPLRQPAWFALRPLEHARLLTEKRSLLLLLQRRPPAEQRPEILAGHYLWEDFHPEGAWRGRYLLTPGKPGTPRRPEALPASYFPLPLGREVAATLASPLGLASVAPELLWVRPGAEPASLGLFVDGSLVWRGELAGTQGSLTLPPLATGRHRLRLEGEGAGGFYLSHGEAGGGLRLKRLANRLAGEGLSFRLAKGAEAEVLSARLYLPHSYRGLSGLRVSIEGPARKGGALQEWTFLDRRYLLEPEPGMPVAVLQSAEQVDGGRAFFIPLGSDLPAGEYRLRVVPEQGPAGYLILARLTPGQQSQRFSYRESEWLQEVADD